MKTDGIIAMLIICCYEFGRNHFIFFSCNPLFMSLNPSPTGVSLRGHGRETTFIDEKSDGKLELSVIETCGGDSLSYLNSFLIREIVHVTRCSEGERLRIHVYLWMTSFHPRHRSRGTRINSLYAIPGHDLCMLQVSLMTSWLSHKNITQTFVFINILVL